MRKNTITIGHPVHSKQLSTKEIPKKQSSQEEFTAYQADLAIISNKINEISDISPRATSGSDDTGGNISSSLFVSNIRYAIMNESGKIFEETWSKERMLEKFLQQINELDKVVLKKTMHLNSDKTSFRRISKAKDLSYLPNHIHLIDRLIDLHTQAKRVTIVRTHSEKEQASNITAESSTESTELLHQNIKKLTKQLDEFPSKLLQLQDENATLKKELIEIRQEILSANIANVK